METLIIIGAGLTISVIRIVVFKKGRKSKDKKLVYYNYSKYIIKHKKMGQSLSEQSKITF